MCYGELGLFAVGVVARCLGIVHPFLSVQGLEGLCRCVFVINIYKGLGNNFGFTLPKDVSIRGSVSKIDLLLEG